MEVVINLFTHGILCPQILTIMSNTHDCKGGKFSKQVEPRHNLFSNDSVITLDRELNWRYDYGYMIGKELVKLRDQALALSEKSISNIDALCAKSTEWFYSNEYYNVSIREEWGGCYKAGDNLAGLFRYVPAKNKIECCVIDLETEKTRKVYAHIYLIEEPIKPETKPEDLPF